MNKTVQQSADFIIDKTDYLAGFQYFNEILRFFPHAEGYVNATKNKFDYDFDYVFNYTDHLGNIRLSYSKDINTNALKVIEENHYYPFGLKHTGYNSDVMLYVLEVAPLLKGQPELFTRKLKPKQSVDLPGNNYKYNGKEYQDELSLNLYDYGNRNYDPAIGRFMNMDRFAEKYYKKTPYQYGGNNPIVFNDIKGDSILIFSKQDKTAIKYENGNLYSRDSKNKWVTYNGKNVKTDKNGNTTIGGFLGKTMKALDKIRNGGTGGNELITTLQNDTKYTRISESNGDNSSGGESGTVEWNQSNNSGGPDQNGNTYRDSYIGLAHELGHVIDGLDGTVDRTPFSPDGGTKSDIIAMHWENRVRGENNVPLRTSYGYDSNGKVIGQALNPNGTSNYFTQPATLQQQTGGASPTPVSSTSPIVIPFRY